MDTARRPNLVILVSYLFTNPPPSPPKKTKKKTRHIQMPLSVKKRNIIIMAMEFYFMFDIRLLPLAWQIFIMFTKQTSP